MGWHLEHFKVKKAMALTGGATNEIQVNAIKNSGVLSAFTETLAVAHRPV